MTLRTRITYVHRSWLGAGIALPCIALVFAACATAKKAQAPEPAPSGLYVSLGDSIAAGNGSSDPARTSFVALLQSDEGGLETLRLAKSGATTQDVIEKQLPTALESVRSKPIAFITISAGGNDLAALVPNPACVQDPLPAACPLDTALSGVEARLDQILQELRAANADAPIVLLAYPNFFSGTGHAFEAPAARVLPRLDDVIRRVAGRYPHTGVAEAAPAFEGRGAELTHVLDPNFDPHPTDAGHRLIADAFMAALDEVARSR